MSVRERLGPAATRLAAERLRHPPPVVTVVRLDGVIGPRQWRSALSLASHAAALDRAFAAARLSAVALAINSPGGSPVQSALLYRRIRQLADEKGVPVFAFAEDVAASGGYWLALAGGGDLRSVMRARFGDNVRLVPIAGARRRRWWWPVRSRPAVDRDVWTPIADFLYWLEARALWARFGL